MSENTSSGVAYHNPEPTNIEQLLSNLEHWQLAVLYAMLEDNVAAVDTGAVDFAGDVMPEVDKGERILRKIDAHVRSDGNYDFFKVHVPSAHIQLKRLAVVGRCV